MNSIHELTYIDHSSKDIYQIFKVVVAVVADDEAGIGTTLYEMLQNFCLHQILYFGWIMFAHMT
ncbi:MAG: hypothetical protein ACI8RD_009121 [Bacillariaceae sp.]|jgi:hypothetical protein